MQKQSNEAVSRHADLPARALNRFVGSWKGEVTVEAIDQEPIRYVQTNRFVWTFDGRFLEERGSGTNESSFLGVWAWDANAELFRAHYFLAPSGDALVIQHRWDEAEQTFTGSSELGGLTVLAQDRFSGADAYSWTIVVQDRSGNPMTRMQGFQERDQRTVG